MNNLGDVIINGNIDISKNLNLNNKFLVDISGNTSIAGSIDISKNLRINNDKFTINSTSGNTYISGNLDTSGNLAVSGTFNLLNDFKINTDKFTVNSSTGEITTKNAANIGTTLKVNDTKFIVNSNGDIISQGYLDLKGDLKINTNKFQINAQTGNINTLGKIDISNTTIDSVFNINTNKFTIKNTGETLIANNLSVGIDKTLFVNTINNSIGINNNNPLYTLDISGNIRGINSSLEKISLDGILNSNYVDFTHLSTYSVEYDEILNEIILTRSGNSTQKSILEYDLSKYTQSIPKELRINFKLSLKKENTLNGNGFWISLYNTNSYINEVEYKPDVLCGGYSIYLNFYDNQITNQNYINIYKNNILMSTINANTLDLVTSNGLYQDISLSAIKKSDYELNIILEVNNQILLDYTINDFFNSNIKYIVFGGSNGSNNVTLTQKIKDIIINVSEYEENNNKLNVYGNSTITQNLNIYGSSYINNDLEVKKTLTCQKIGSYGKIIKMPEIYDSSFKFKAYTNNPSSYYYDSNQMIIYLNKEEITNSKNIIEFNISEYLDNITTITYSEFMFNISLIKTAYLEDGGIGFWVSLSNTNSYITTQTLSYDISLNGINLLIDCKFGNIKLYYNGVNIETQTINDARLLKSLSNNEIYNNVRVKCSKKDNNTIIQLLINNIQYFIYELSNYNLIGRYYCIGSINGGLLTTLTQKVKNIELYVEYQDIEKSLQILGETLFKGDVNIEGPLNVNGNVKLNKIMIDSSTNYLGIGNLTPEFELDVSGNINFTGSLYKDGELYISSQWTEIGNQLYYIGNLGIGITDPIARLDISGNDSTTLVRLTNTGNGKYLEIENKFIINNDGNIDSSGNINIGKNLNYINKLIPSSNGKLNGVSITALNKKNRIIFETIKNKLTNNIELLTSSTLIKRSIVYSPSLNLFVTIGNGDTILTSNNLSSWNVITLAESMNFSSICWSDKLSYYVAVGPKVMLSSNGSTWIYYASSNMNNYWTSICWSEELEIFVAVADSGTKRVMTSTNGINWSGYNSADETKSWNNVSWNADLGIFIASSDTDVMISTNGTLWEIYSLGIQDITIKSITWSSELGIYIACGISTNNKKIAISENGKNWTLYNTIYNIYELKWIPELSIFMATASSINGNYIIISSNGVQWHSIINNNLLTLIDSKIYWISNISKLIYLFSNDIYSSTYILSTINNAILANQEHLKINNTGYITIGSTSNDSESKLKIYNNNFNQDSLQAIGNCKLGAGLIGSSNNYGGGPFFIQKNWNNTQGQHSILYPNYCIGDNSAGTINIQISNKSNKVGNIILSFIKESTNNTNIFVVALQKNSQLITLSVETNNNDIIINTDNDCAISWTSQGSF